MVEFLCRYVPRTQLAVPEVVVKECERHLAERATGKVKSVHAALSWLARFCGEVIGWKLPRDAGIAERVQAAARGEAFDAVVITDACAETTGRSPVLRRARTQSQKGAGNPRNSTRNSEPRRMRWAGTT